MRKIEDEELREFQKQIGRGEYNKIQHRICMLSKNIRDTNRRASRDHYDNSEEKLEQIKEKYKNGVTMDILSAFVDL